MSESSRKKSRKFLWIALLLLIAIAGATAAVIHSRTPEAKPDTANVPAAPAKPAGIGARGRIEPEDGIMIVAAPYNGGNPALIKELKVKEGDWIQAGQIVAVLHGYPVSEKNVRQSEAAVEVARKKLSQVQAGPTKSGDIDAQKMEIARWESELAIATSDYQRAEKLRKEEIMSPADFDQRRLVMERNKRVLDSARERLKSLEEIRKVDVDVASAELSSAQAQVDRATAELDEMTVKAPTSGRVLKVLAHSGEEGSKGIFEIGKTNRMYVIAEVYESDISRVRVGQTARISGELVPEEITGTVKLISAQVTKSELLSMSPTEFADSRVVNVKILLKDGERVAGLIHGKVNVVIQPDAK